MIEAGFGLVGLGSHVPFAEEAGLVAGLLQVRWEEGGAGGNRSVVVHNPVAVGVLSGQNRRPARRAQRRGDERVLEVDPFARHAVELRSFEERLRFQEAHGVVTMIVGEDEDHVARFGGGGGGRKRGAPHGGEQLTPVHFVRIRTPS